MATTDTSDQAAAHAPTDATKTSDGSSEAADNRPDDGDNADDSTEETSEPPAEEAAPDDDAPVVVEDGDDHGHDGGWAEHPEPEARVQPVEVWHPEEPEALGSAEGVLRERRARG